MKEAPEIPPTPGPNIRSHGWNMFFLGLSTGIGLTIIAILLALK